ncbi:DeoR/GlpR family DNA-binding transcription regulator [Salipiger pallidus]|nr:DeoR/GlpR family DNA-binding transcription regulator [Salipiger pallidus]
MAEPNISSQRRHRAARQDCILTELRAQPSMRASELAQKLDVSHETIRRDIIDLDRRGLLRRTYGGAERPLRIEAPLAERRTMHVNTRHRIGAEAAALVGPGEVVMIGSESTCWHMVRSLAAGAQQVTAITNYHSVAEALCDNPGAQIITLGGRLHPTERYAWGPQAIEELTRYRANWAMFGASGIDGSGVYDIDDHAAGICRRMFRQAGRVAVLADSSKFGMPALARIASWPEIDLLVVDTPPQGAIAATLSAQGVRILSTSKKTQPHDDASPHS